MKTFHIVCPHDCPDTCSIQVNVDESGRAIKVQGNPQHPTTDGVLCTKVSRYLDRVYHPERLMTPLRRVGRKGEGKFERISWEEALASIAEQLTSIAARNPEAIVPCSYGGTMGIVQKEGMAARFFNKLGASLLDRTVCASAGAAALKATLGAGVGADLEQVQNARLILIWGSNPVVCGVHFWRRAQEAQRKGALLIAIDPHRSLTAQKCDQHLAPLPGTDGALALALIHILIRDNWLDHDYINHYTLGFEALKQRAADFPPEKAAQICSLSVEQIEQLAAVIGQTAVQAQQPVLIKAGYGMQRVRGGGNAVRAIACIPALIGAWRHAAGGHLMSTSGMFPMNTARLERADLWPNGKKPRTINLSQVGDALLQQGDTKFGAKVEAVIVYNCNPLAILPDSEKVVAGFKREDLFTVVIEQFQTDTADYADIILPATTQLEHEDLHKSYGHYYLMKNQAAIAPLGECKRNSEIFRLLAAQMGLTDAALQADDDSIMRDAMHWDHEYTSKMCWETLQTQGWERLNVANPPFAKGGFPTASGKCEFFSKSLMQQGIDPVPNFIEPHESVLSQPELAKQFPLQMISPPEQHFLNSSFVNVGSLRKKTLEPTLEIHPNDADERSIQSDQPVRVFNKRGSFQAKAQVTERARPGVVVAPSIWWRKYSRDGKNCNDVSSQALTDMGAAATYYDCLVQVEAL